MFDLKKLDNVRVGVLGDFAVDIYWYADMKQSQLSRETPHYPLPVVREKMNLGAAGNVAANLAALAIGNLAICGVRGNDWRGVVLEKMLHGIGADITGLVTEEDRFTQAYCKPMRMGISDVVYEDPRLDFAAQSAPSSVTEKAVLQWLDKADENLDVLCVCDQSVNGILTDAVIRRLSALKIPVMVDSRSRIGQFRIHGLLKPNEVECRNAVLSELGSLPDEPGTWTNLLSAKTGADVLLTLGEKGCLFVSADGKEAFSVPAQPVSGEIDICGAGDTFLSAFAAFTAAGASADEAAKAATIASYITIQKIGMTGTASREEIIQHLQNTAFI